MSDLQDLYQELILDHNRNPRNYGALDRGAQAAEGYNPLCGDRVKLYTRVVGGEIQEVHFEGSGCAISTASASLLTEAVKGKSVEEAEAMFQQFHRMLTGGEADVESMGKLAAFAHVAEYPMRVKCATLAWHTFKAALEKRAEVVSTE